MRALVIGASGQVGASLLSVLRARGHEGQGTHGTHPVPGLVPLDLTAHAAVERLIASSRADWIFCPAGLSHVDYCEDHADEAYAINREDRKSTRLNSSHGSISYDVFCLKKKN